MHVIRVSFSFRILIKFYEAEIALCCAPETLLDGRMVFIALLLRV